jgi:hypothetical protein
VHKFSPEEERLLVRYGEMASWVPDADEEDEGGVVFCDDDIDTI